MSIYSIKYEAGRIVKICALEPWIGRRKLRLYQVEKSAPDWRIRWKDGKRKIQVQLKLLTFLNVVSHSWDMEFFKLTWLKVMYTIILYLFPQATIFLISAFSGGGLEQIASWSPVELLVALFFPNSWHYGFWQTNTFHLFVFPISGVLFWYLISCTIIYFTNKRKSGKRSNS